MFPEKAGLTKSGETKLYTSARPSLLFGSQVDSPSLSLFQGTQQVKGPQVKVVFLDSPLKQGQHSQLFCPLPPPRERGSNQVPLPRPESGWGGGAVQPPALEGTGLPNALPRNAEL